MDSNQNILIMMIAFSIIHGQNQNIIISINDVKYDQNNDVYFISWSSDNRSEITFEPFHLAPLVDFYFIIMAKS